MPSATELDLLSSQYASCQGRPKGGAWHPLAQKVACRASFVPNRGNRPQTTALGGFWGDDIDGTIRTLRPLTRHYPSARSSAFS
jgi:hypothetical protein